jgi:DNA-binding NarL/FixJ family response regulator
MNACAERAGQMAYADAMTPVDAVAVFNSNADTIEMLRVALQQAGLTVVAAFTQDLRDGTIDVRSFMEKHDPAVVIYDVAPPYDANWALFERLRVHPSMANRHFVLTSTDATAVHDLAHGTANVYQIAEKPFDLDVIVTAVSDAASARPTVVSGPRPDRRKR